MSEARNLSWDVLERILRERMPSAMASGMTTAVWAEALPDSPAVISAAGERTFGELNAHANQAARALRAAGLVSGDAVALLCSNRPEFAEIFAATRRAGFRLTPINSHLTAEEAAYIAVDCDAKALVVDARFAEVGRHVADQADAATVRLAVGGAIAGFEDYDEVLSRYDAHDIEAPVLGSSMLYTSGTTGQPKGVNRPSRPPASLGNGQGPPEPGTALLQAGYRPGQDRHLLTGPLYHAAPMGFSLGIPHLFGAAVVMMDKWDAEQALALIEAHRVTHTHMVPTMFQRLLALPEEVRGRYDLSSLRYVLHGAAPCPVPIKRRLIEWLGPVVHEYYAATEGVGTIVDSETWLKKPGTVGKPYDPDHIKIMDEHGHELGPDEVGRVYIRVPETAGRFHYYKDEAKTRNAFRGEHYTLGDMGYLDADGFLFLTDRSAHLIISGGVNIYPAEAEAVLATHRAVADVAVIGVPNEEWGEEVKAVVELEAGYEASAALEHELVQWCRARLSHYKCPRSVDFVEALPRADSGKLYKEELRARYRQR